MAFDRKAAKKALLKRTQEANARKDQGQYGNIFKRSDLPLWNPENGKHKFDIIPYIAGKHDPQVKKGEPTYLLDVWVHRRMGLDDQYVCLAKNYRRDCAICNFRRQYESTLTEDQLKDLTPKRRTVYNVVSRDPADKGKGVQVFEIAHWFMEKNILAQAENPDEGGVLPFSDPEDGYTIYFKRSGSNESTVYDSHKLLPREYKIKDRILDEAHTLDEEIHIPTEEELEQVAKLLKKKLVSTKSEDAEDEDDDDDDREERSSSKRKGKKKPSDDDDDDDDVPEDLGDDDDDDEDEKPAKKKKGKKPSDDDDDDEEDGDDDDDEDEKPAKKKAKAGKCPEGGTFGEDFDQFDGCVDCSNFDECSDKHDELEKSSKKKKKKSDEDDDEDDDEPKKKKKKAADDDDDEEDDDDEQPKKKSKFNRRTGR